MRGLWYELFVYVIFIKLHTQKVHTLTPTLAKRASLLITLNPERVPGHLISPSVSYRRELGELRGFSSSLERAVIPCCDRPTACKVARVIGSSGVQSTKGVVPKKDVVICKIYYFFFFFFSQWV